MASTGFRGSSDGSVINGGDNTGTTSRRPTEVQWPYAVPNGYLDPEYIFVALGVTKLDHTGISLITSQLERLHFSKRALVCGTPSLYSL